MYIEPTPPAYLGVSAVTWIWILIGAGALTLAWHACAGWWRGLSPYTYDPCYNKTWGTKKQQTRATQANFYIPADVTPQPYVARANVVTEAVLFNGTNQLSVIQWLRRHGINAEYCAVTSPYASGNRIDLHTEADKSDLTWVLEGEYIYIIPDRRMPLICDAITFRYFYEKEAIVKLRS